VAFEAQFIGQRIGGFPAQAERRIGDDGVKKRFLRRVLPEAAGDSTRKSCWLSEAYSSPLFGKAAKGSPSTGLAIQSRLRSMNPDEDLRA
jgi:hypothetical protein